MPLFVVYLLIIYLYTSKRVLLCRLSMLLFLIFLGRNGYSSILFLRYLLNGVVFGYVFAYVLKKNLSLFHVVLFSFLPEFVFMTLCTIVPHYKNEFNELIATTYKAIETQLGSAELTNSGSIMQLKLLFPVAEFFKHIATILLLLLFFNKRVGRIKEKITDFVLPDWFVWVFAGGLLFSIVEIFGDMGVLVLLATTVFYLLSGVSITRLYFTKVKVSRLSEVLFYMLQSWLFFMPFIFIGLFETWLGFRKRILKPKTENSI